VSSASTYASWRKIQNDVLNISDKRKIDLVPRHHGARFGFFKNLSKKLKKISTCSKRWALQICKFLKKNTLYFEHSKKDKYGYFLEYGGPFKIALFMVRSTIFSFLLRLEYKIFSHDFYHASSTNYSLHPGIFSDLFESSNLKFFQKKKIVLHGARALNWRSRAYRQYMRLHNNASVYFAIIILLFQATMNVRG
jgi:hypothetical protein